MQDTAKEKVAKANAAAQAAETRTAGELADARARRPREECRGAAGGVLHSRLVPWWNQTCCCRFVPYRSEKSKQSHRCQTFFDIEYTI